VQTRKCAHIYLRLPLVDDDDLDVWQWWRARKSAFPVLARLAARLLVVPATSVPVERLFSKLKHLVTPARNQLSAERMQQLLVIKESIDSFPECLHDYRSADDDAAAGGGGGGDAAPTAAAAAAAGGGGGEGGEAASAARQYVLVSTARAAAAAAAAAAATAAPPGRFAASTACGKDSQR
jgi:hypothetical protein